MSNISRENCAVCNKELAKPHRKTRKFCSQVCKDKARYVSRPRSKYRAYLTLGAIGAAAELEVSADLLRRGYAVFRAVSPSCFCDLVAMQGHRTIRIEVRTGYFRPTGYLHFTKGKNDVGKQDCFAVVHSTGIVYVPPLPE